MAVDEQRNSGNGQGRSLRRRAKVAVVVAGLAVLGGAGLSGALAQQDDDGVFGSSSGDDLAAGIIADVFASGGFDFDDDVFVVDVPTGGSGTGISGGGGDINVGGNTGGSVTMGGGSSGGITIGGGMSDTGSGGGSGNSGSSGGSSSGSGGGDYE